MKHADAEHICLLLLHELSHQLESKVPLTGRRSDGFTDTIMETKLTNQRPHVEQEGFTHALSSVVVGTIPA